MPNTLHEKALKQPFRVGLVLGALAVPLGWVISQDALRLAFVKPMLDSEEVTRLFAAGVFPGMILGAGAVRAWAAWRDRKSGGTRWFLLGHSLGGILSCWVFMPPLLGAHSYLLARPPQGWNSPLTDYAFLFYDVFPLQVALAMLLWGILMRPARA